MIAFCNKCGSLRTKYCTNKKCKDYKKQKLVPATYEQEQYIRDLQKKVGDENYYDKLTKDEATEIINELLQKLEAKE